MTNLSVLSLKGGGNGRGLQCSVIMAKEVTKLEAYSVGLLSSEIPDIFVSGEEGT